MLFDIVKQTKKQMPKISLFSRAILSFVLVIGAGVFLGAGAAHAQGALGQDWSQFLTGWLPNFNNASAPGETLAIGFIRNAVRIVKYAVGALAVLFGVLYAMALVLAGDKEETLTQQKKNFTGIAIAFVLLMIADNVAGIFNPEGSNAQQLIDFGAANDQLRDIVNYIKWLLGSVLVLLFTISGFKLITAQGEDEKITQEKKHLVGSLIGIFVLLLASNIVNAVYTVNQVTGATAPAVFTTPIQEAAGGLRLFLVFLGPFAVLFSIYAGFLYMTSFGSEENTTKAKTLLIGGITAIVIIYLAYAIVNTLIVSPLDIQPAP